MSMGFCYHRCKLGWDDEHFQESELEVGIGTSLAKCGTGSQSDLGGKNFAGGVVVVDTDYHEGLRPRCLPLERSAIQLHAQSLCNVHFHRSSLSGSSVVVPALKTLPLHELRLHPPFRGFAQARVRRKVERLPAAPAVLLSVVRRIQETSFLKEFS